ncbi:ATP-binding protein [Ideonella sp. BN130291]|uniref:ATP-binding protein n=1 Tax=Ideonella sp. BN130291 TaxID=3112940 RepID=UPI002E2661EA|nr:ATP-binding protein [Ideonella sp. BN130291]
MRSIRRRLLVWVLGALSVGAAVLLAVSYWALLGELDEVFDESLKQVALAVAEHHPPGAATALPRSALPPLPHVYEEDADFDYVTFTWSLDGRLLYASDASVKLPFRHTNGSDEVRADGGERWHVYTVVRSDGVVQAAQRASLRRLLAAGTAAYLLVPLLLLIALIGVLLVIALRRGLQPLDRAAQSVAERSAVSLAPIGEAGMPREIHPLVRAIDGLMARLAEAFRVQRQFVADAAHELRSPITALRLQLQLLERTHDDAARQAATQELKAGIERAQHLIEQLLALSRVEPEGPPSAEDTVDLGELARGVVAALSIQAEHLGVDLGADTPASGPTTRGDRQQLQILLTNLVENALRHAPSGTGVVDVRAGVLAQRPALQVLDNGPGIAAAERERVFDRFYRGDGQPAAQQGSGLGLAIVKAIAQRHRADVSLHDAPAGGLDVRVLF